MTAQVYATFYTSPLKWHFNKTRFNDVQRASLFSKTFHTLKTKKIPRLSTTVGVWTLVQKVTATSSH